MDLGFGVFEVLEATGPSVEIADSDMTGTSALSADGQGALYRHLGCNIGALIMTYTVLGVPCFQYCLIYP